MPDRMQWRSRGRNRSKHCCTKVHSCLPCRTSLFLAACSSTLQLLATSHTGISPMSCILYAKGKNNCHALSSESLGLGLAEAKAAVCESLGVDWVEWYGRLACRRDAHAAAAPWEHREEQVADARLSQQVINDGLADRGVDELDLGRQQVLGRPEGIDAALGHGVVSHVHEAVECLQVLDSAGKQRRAHLCLHHLAGNRHSTRGAARGERDDPVCCLGPRRGCGGRRWRGPRGEDGHGRWRGHWRRDGRGENGGRRGREAHCRLAVAAQCVGARAAAE
mmetsp:Transcript_38712/g.115044  ORF Transcript_38712/g.115044 Transcript_38712/m.115044 type:complete len:278 (-) Transcript_38712:372-1205(-)